MDKKIMNMAIFLDRDGTINKEVDYLYKIEDFKFLDGVPEAIRKINDARFLVIVITNQAGIARGYYSEEDVHRLHKYIDIELNKYGAHINAWYYCPHHPVLGIGKYKIDCECRKPKSGMLEQAIKDFNVDRESSWMVGDKQSDIIAGKNAGLHTALVGTGYGLEELKNCNCGYDIFMNDLLGVLDYILRDT